ncbi:hypothetical protein [Tenacibaculum caenipelagi]|uniref:Lipoprotein n=1 Tax=Tenacibaculum caenipelagi TaxID=1325435 RepID=A0A4R6TC61_9FLAO|nr:hypothetical protein [Tenacibaculum caenipelagi]TDQ21922.1 hypothetical protein DFQ07_3018 [Tenacibaculum caenipelagi]
MKKTNLLQLLFLTLAVSFAVSCEKTDSKCDCDDWRSQVPEGTFCYSDEGRTKEMLNYKEIVEMLSNYDRTRIAPIEKTLGYEDTRANTFDFAQFKKYLAHVENMSKKANIEITGISFISTAKENHNNTGKSYSSLIYIPTTTINDKQIAFDPVQSAKQGKLVTFKEMLAKHGYKWIYNTKEEFEKGKRDDYNYNIRVLKENKAGFMYASPLNDESLSGAGNQANLEPPYAN